MSSKLLPDEASIGDLLSGLFGSDVAVKSAESPSGEGSSIVATYCDDDGKIVRVAECDCSLANRLGAALTMFPPAGANDAIKAGEVLDKHLENLTEVLNICVNLFSELSDGHITLDKVFQSGAEDDLAQEAKSSASETAQFDVDIPRYGNGVISLSVVD